MSISGLLRAISDDPQLSQALDHAALRAAGGGDLIAPASLRPMLAAALTGHGAEPNGTNEQRRRQRVAGRFVLAVTATAREAEELTAALSSLLPPDSVAYFPAWETLPHERLSPRSDTSGQRLAVLRRLAHPDPADPRTGPLLAVAAPVRSLLQPMVGGLGELLPVRLERRPVGWTWTRSSPGWSRSATRASSWSSGAARSRSAAASWTCSRRPRSTRCGSSSGATRSRRSATSRWPTSAAWRWPRTACGRRRAASCC